MHPKSCRVFSEECVGDVIAINELIGNFLLPVDEIKKQRAIPISSTCSRSHQLHVSHLFCAGIIEPHFIPRTADQSILSGSDNHTHFSDFAHCSTTTARLLRIIANRHRNPSITNDDHNSLPHDLPKLLATVRTSPPYMTFLSRDLRWLHHSLSRRSVITPE